MRCYRCLFVALIFGYTVFQDVSGVARFTRSADESLRDLGTYIVHFKKSATNAEIRQFVTDITQYEAKILSEFLNIKSLSARLSEQAVIWVRIICFGYLIVQKCAKYT